MTARAEKFTFQTRPTPAQNDVMVRANRARYARQYRDNQDEAIAEMHAARLRYEMARNADVSALTTTNQPEPCQFCAVEDESPEFPLPLFLAICIGALGLWGAIGYATWWIAPKAVDLITWILEKLA